MTRSWTGNLYILGQGMLKDCHAVSSRARLYGKMLNGDFGIPNRSQVVAEIGLFESETIGGVIGGDGGTTEVVGGTTAVIGVTLEFVGPKVMAACCAAGSRRTSAPCAAFKANCRDKATCWAKAICCASIRSIRFRFWRFLLVRVLRVVLLVFVGRGYVGFQEERRN